MAYTKYILYDSQSRTIYWENREYGVLGKRSDERKHLNWRWYLRAGVKCLGCDIEHTKWIEISQIIIKDFVKQSEEHLKEILSEEHWNYQPCHVIICVGGLDT